jgi:tRNA(Arg) A34 adenosine deaminase TadA
MQAEEQFMREALELACASVERGGGPFGAVVVLGGKVVGRGHNRVTLDNDPTAHAEVVAIRDACRNLATFRLDGCTLYVSCEPCPMCMSAAYWARLDGVYYSASREQAAEAGFDDLFVAEELRRPPAERSLPLVPFFTEAGDGPFQRWRNTPERTEY